MPLVFAENEATESGISYDDRTGISYQYPGRYRRVIQSGERFIYYRGRRTKVGRRMPQIYFGSGGVGNTFRDPNQPDRLMCEVLDYRAFSVPIPFKNARGEYLETGADRRGYFQPGVRVISEDDFRRITEAAQMDTIAAEESAGAPGGDANRGMAPGYASLATLRFVEDFAVRVALDEIRRRYPGSMVQPQPRNNPGFDILVKQPEASADPVYVEVKGTTRGYPHFFMTEGEVQFSLRHQDRYHLIVVYRICLDPETYDLHWHEGPVSVEGGFRLNPVQWSVQAVSGETIRPADTE